MFAQLGIYVAYKMDVQIHVSPRMLCGKTVRIMTGAEREAYDNAQRRLAEQADTTEKHNRAEHDALDTHYLRKL